MRAVIQRSNKASVVVNNIVIGKIENGLTIFLGICNDDNEKDLKYITDKIINLRIFPDLSGKMNLSVLDVKGALLVVSQFTLYGECHKGRRPGFSLAAHPVIAKKLYEKFINICQFDYNIKVESGQFQTEMVVNIENSGPVTIIIDSKKIY